MATYVQPVQAVQAVQLQAVQPQHQQVSVHEQLHQQLHQDDCCSGGGQREVCGCICSSEAFCGIVSTIGSLGGVFILLSLVTGFWPLFWFLGLPLSITACALPCCNNNGGQNGGCCGDEVRRLDGPHNPSVVVINSQPQQQQQPATVLSVQAPAPQMAEVTVVGSSPPPTTTARSFCVNCGAPLTGAAFCSGCGSASNQAGGVPQVVSSVGMN